MNASKPTQVHYSTAVCKVLYTQVIDSILQFCKILQYFEMTPALCHFEVVLVILFVTSYFNSRI